MDRNSRKAVSDKAIATVCVGGVYIIDKRVGHNRRHISSSHPKKYDRRLSNWAKSFNRRSRLIDILI